MRVLFWASFFVIAYAYFGYLVLLILLSLTRSDNGIDSTSTSFEPNVSLIIPVYNEEKVIDEKIQNILSLDYPKDKLEILIASDASTDRTREIVRKYEEMGVKILEQSDRRGKAGALNLGLREAKNEIVIFSDASIFLDKEALRNLLQRFSDSQIGCVTSLNSCISGIKTFTTKSSTVTTFAPGS